MNEFLAITSSPFMNLDHTYRYSGTKLVEAESLSQHIIDTIMMGLKIIDKINTIADFALIDPRVYLMKAVYHDLEEVITGDIPRPLKYYNESTKESLKDVADKVAKELFNKEFTKGDFHYNLWKDAKEDDAGYILKLVDTLVVANKVIKEVTLLHNFYMLRVAHEVSQYLKSMLNIEYFKEYNVDHYLDNLIEGAIESMRRIIEDNETVMKNLDIYGQSMI